jgi:hypothetical protein
MRGLESELREGYVKLTLEARVYRLAAIKKTGYGLPYRCTAVVLHDALAVLERVPAPCPRAGIVGALLRHARAFDRCQEVREARLASRTQGSQAHEHRDHAGIDAWDRLAVRCQNTSLIVLANERPRA